MSLIKSYNRLPPAARSAAATLWGAWLMSWRFGHRSRALVAEARGRESWPSDRWEAWRHQQLTYLLQRAATTVPYYRRFWAALPDAVAEERCRRLQEWPVLSKEEVRADPSAFVSDDRRRRFMYTEHTSGSTGTPLTLWWSRSTVQRWFALRTARILEWHGLRRSDRWAMLGGQLVVPVEQTHPPFWVWNAVFRQLYMSSYHLTPEWAATYLRAMRERRVNYVLGYASSMYSLARFADELSLEAPRLRCAISNAEPLFDHQREVISKVFGCPVVDTYGSGEIVAAGSECGCGSMHQWPEVGVVEVLADEEDSPLPSGEVGRLVCTGLLNVDMPLIRYEIGDRGAVDDSPCSCGRGLPVFSEITGRTDDVLVLRDGRRIGRLDPVFKSDLRIHEAQIVQESLDLVRVRVVPGPGFGPSAARAIVDRLAERLGDVRIELDEVESIERTASGKFRAVVSRIDHGD